MELSKSVAHLALKRLKQLDKDGVNSYSFSSEVPREIKAVADVIIEELIIDKLSSIGIDILSEESGLIEGKSDSSLRFIIDPIDGSVNFVRGITECSISIALYNGESPIFGVLASYPSGKISWGGNGIGAFTEESALKVSMISDSKKGVLCSGFPSRFIFDHKSISDQINIMTQFSKVRMLGSASQSLLQVARGSVECYIENEIMIWDVAAGIAIVEGAGGNIEIAQGSSINSLNVIANNSTIKFNNVSL
jgi:myo-inositol-1(or 4)-monophosphatase